MTFRIADVADVLLEAPVAPSFTRIGYDVRSVLEHWKPLASYDLRGRVMLLTGATSGLGLAAAEALAHAGATLILLGRDAAKTKRVRDDLARRTDNDRLSTLIADMGDLDAVRRAAGEVLASHGALHVLVHNAGALHAKRRGGPTRWFRLSICLLSLALLGACATDRVPPLNAMDRTVDLQRFMGDWYVIGFIPITLPFLSEDGAHNGVESYRLTDEGVIETTYTFRDGGFDGPEKRFTPKGWVHDHETNAEWRMQFLWPFKSAYLIVYLDEDYQKTIIGVPDRSNVWIMSRNPQMSDAEYQRMLRYTASLGYDVAKVKRVPQRWPAE